LLSGVPQDGIDPEAGAAAAPASGTMPSCGTPESNAAPMRPCKVATMAAADTPFAPKF